MMSRQSFLFTLLLLVTGTLSANDRPIIFAGDEDFAPLSYWHNGAPQGFYVDLVLAVGARLGVPYFPTLENWAQAQADLQAGKVDVVFGLSYTQGRAKLFDLTDPLWQDEFTFFSRGRPEIGQIKDLNHLRVGATGGGLPRTLLEPEVQTPLILFQTYEAGFDALEAGTIDVFAGDRWVGSYLLSKGSWPGVGPATSDFASLPTGLGVQKGNSELLARLNVAIRAVRAKGTFDVVSDRWRPKAVVLLTNEQIFLALAAILGLLLVASVVWVLVLLREIRRRERAEQGLGRMRASFEQAQWGMAIAHGNGTVVQVNWTYAQMHGYEPAELIGTSASLLIAPESREAHREFLLRDAGTLVSEEIVRLRKDGSRFAAMVTISRLASPKDPEPLLVANVLDITERRQFEQTISEQAAQLRALFNNLPDLVWLKDNSGRYLRSNRRFQSFCGLAEQEIQGRTDLDIFDRVRAEEFQKEDQQVLSLRQTVTWEGLHRFADGHEEYLETVKAPVYGLDGKILGVLGLARDISQRRRDFEALKQSEAKFLKVFHANPSSVLIYDRTTLVILDVNDSFVRITGFDRSEVLGKKAQDLGTLVSMDGLEQYREVVRREQILRGLEMSFRMKSGEMRTFLVYSEPLTLDGRPCRLDYHLDVTELKKMTGEKFKLQADLYRAQRMESLGLLAGGIAHDMNNVLGAILGMASTSLPTVSEGPVHHAFEVIAKAAERGGVVVKTLLGFARQSPAESRLLNFNTLIQEQVFLLQRSFLAHCQVKMDLAEDLSLVVGDEPALMNVIMNLIRNAVDAMAGPGILELKTRNLGSDSIEVEVSDNGTGMPPEVLEKAFDPFFTTKPVGQGTGLGLSLVYATVTAHGGLLKLVSEVGRGTSVIVTLPASTQKARLAEPEVVEPSAGLRVLVIDDDELILETFREILANLGHSLTTVTSGEEALKSLEAGLRPDLVILDMTMPGQGGAGTLPGIRKLLPGVPVILSTGLVNQTALDLVAGDPHVSLLSKPFTVEELKAMVQQMFPDRNW